MKRWTIEEISTLRKLVTNGLLYRDIGKILTRSTRSIQGKCNNLGITNAIHRNIKHTNESYDIKLKSLTSYIVREGMYINVTTPILHKCLICGESFLSTPKQRFSGYGHCGTSYGNGVPLDNPAITYLVYIPKYNIHKIGITSKTVKERMSDNKISNYESILEILHNKGIDAIELEKVWKENLKDYLINTKLLKSGNTETFRY